MSKANPFTQEQLRILENNVYTHHVTKEDRIHSRIQRILCRTGVCPWHDHKKDHAGCRL